MSFSIGTRSDGLTALMLAAVAGHSAAVRALLAGGVALDTEEEAPDGMPPSTAGTLPATLRPSRSAIFRRLPSNLFASFSAAEGQNGSARGHPAQQLAGEVCKKEERAQLLAP